MVALGSRLDWGQLTDLLERCNSVEEMRKLAFYSRNRKQQFPLVFSTIMLTGATGEISRSVLTVRTIKSLCGIRPVPVIIFVVADNQELIATELGRAAGQLATRPPETTARETSMGLG